MKFFARTSLLGSVLGLILLTAAPSFGSVVEDLYVGGDGSATVTPTGITFNENDSLVSSMEAGIGTTFTYSIGSTLVVGHPIDTGAITLSPLSSSVSVTFPDAGTSAILAVSGAATDGSSVSEVEGNRSATITGETSGELTAPSSYTTPSSGTVVINAAPEPRTFVLIALAGLLMGLVVKRKKGEA